MVFLMVILTACAAVKKPVEVECDWVTYTEDDGLVSNNVTSIAIEKNGTIWIGTWGGGISRFDGEGNWNEIIESEYLGSKYIRSLAVDNSDVVWISTDAGINHYDTQNRSWGELNREYEAHDIAFASDGTIWFAEWQDLTSYNGSEWVTLSMGGSILESVAVAADNSVWVGTLADGVVHIDQQGQQTRYTREDGLPGGSIQDIAVAPDQTIWAAINGGAAHFDGGEWIVYSEELVSSAVSSVTFTPDGAVWFGSWEGVSRFDGTGWTLWPMGRIGSITTSPIETAPDGSVWFGTDQGLMHCE